MQTVRFFIVCLVVILSSKVSFSQSFEEINNPALPGVSYGSVDWGDYDSDGDLDLLLAGRKANLEYITKIFTNDGTGIFTELTQAALPGIYIGVAKWVDIDNDNDLDIFISGNSDGNDAVITSIYINNGNNTFSELSQNIFQVMEISSADVGDIDNDGDIDIMMCGSYDNNSFTKIYTNNGNLTFTELQNTGIVDAFSGNITCGDYDNDGDLDILITGRSTSSNYVSRIYTNQGDGTFVVLEGLPFPTEGWSNCNWGDYDNDGDLDIVMIGYAPGVGRNTKVFTNQGNGVFEELTATTFEGISEGDVEWGDYNNDGYLDLLFSGSTGNTPPISKLYANNGDATFTLAADFAPPIAKYGTLAWADIDNDKDLDFVITGLADEANDVAITKVFINKSTEQNQLPNMVSNMSYAVNGQDVTFTWQGATDGNQNGGLSYNLYVLHAATNAYVLPPSASTAQTDNNGRRMIAARASIQAVNNNDGTYSYTLKGFYTPDEQYHWGVQAVDASFKGGPFVEEAFDFIEETASTAKLVVYPNPTTDKLYIHAETKILSLSIYNINGQLVLKKHQYDDKQPIDVSSLSKGVYTVKTYTTKGVAVLNFSKI